MIHNQAMALVREPHPLQVCARTHVAPCQTYLAAISNIPLQLFTMSSNDLHFGSPKSTPCINCVRCLYTTSCLCLLQVSVATHTRAPTATLWQHLSAHKASAFWPPEASLVPQSCMYHCSCTGFHALAHVICTIVSAAVKSFWRVPSPYCLLRQRLLAFAVTYNQGAVITLRTKLTANHGGKFSFRICPRTDNLIPECFGTNYLLR